MKNIVCLLCLTILGVFYAHTQNVSQVKTTKTTYKVVNGQLIEVDQEVTVEKYEYDNTSYTPQQTQPQVVYVQPQQNNSGGGNFAKGLVVGTILNNFIWRGAGIGWQSLPASNIRSNGYRNSCALFPPLR
jgi:hypothetical protein